MIRLKRFNKIHTNITIGINKEDIDIEKMFANHDVVQMRWRYIKNEYLSALIAYDIERAKALSDIMSELKRKANRVGKEKILV